MRPARGACRHNRDASYTPPHAGRRGSVCQHGLFTPGTHLPIYPTELIDEIEPDVILVLPWNIVGEISAQLAHTAAWGAKLAVAIPRTTLFEPGELPG